MSNTVLARKWRPKTFATLVGQDHVVRALTHALERGRLHHAYLFTGTRGVGKTTIARILAKSLNCTGPDGSGGVTAQPCGACPACTEIDAGRFVDYIELDAASNRGVDDMTRLLEQAVYKPTAGRYKVYMIDEVHMLSNHAFNAMLKTLEEPPESVKFVLATTDPQKVPVTVLSRCLQFGLKSMTPQAIASYLQGVLHAEGVDAEAQALLALGRAAHGSMRDALSLTDQAIAYNAGTISLDGVRSMLGAVDAGYLFDLLRALAVGDGAALLGLADAMDARGLSFGNALEDLAGLLQRVAVAQVVPDAVDATDPDAPTLRELAAALSPETVQLAYSMVLHGRAELVLAPDELAGFSMLLLRLLAFAPISTAGAVPRDPSLPQPPRVRTAVQASADKAAAVVPDASKTPQGLSLTPTGTATKASVPASHVEVEATAPAAVVAADRADRQAAADTAGSSSAAPTQALGFPGPDPDWPTLAARLQLVALTRSLAMHSEWVGAQGDTWSLRVPSEQYTRAGALDRLQTALSDALGRPLQLRVDIGAVCDTANLRAIAARRALQEHAEAVIAADPLVRDLVDGLGAQLVPGSIRPIE